MRPRSARRGERFHAERDPVGLTRGAVKRSVRAAESATVAVEFLTSSFSPPITDSEITQSPLRDLHDREVAPLVVTPSLLIVTVSNREIVRFPKRPRGAGDAPARADTGSADAGTPEPPIEEEAAVSTLSKASRSWLVVAIALLLAAGGSTGCGQSAAAPGEVKAALVPPPPVNQSIGIYDQTFAGFAIRDCFSCHATQAPACTDPLAPCQQVSAQHHNLLDPTNPHFNATYTCSACHPTVVNPTTGQYEMKVTLDCKACHVNSPHHTSAAAAAADCKACHGNTVSNIADKAPIPTYSPSSVTPATGCRVWTDATHTTCKAGGCAACHSASTAATPQIADNKTLHHGTGLGVSPNPGTQCGWCHSIHVTNGVPSAGLDIRTCEQCHPLSSLHNIQLNYNTTNGTPGYGHMGADQDCWGCHGWFAKYEIAPGAGATVPTISYVTPNIYRKGTAYDVAITGQSLTNSITYPDGATATFDPVVVIGQYDELGVLIGSPTVLTPASFTETDLAVQIPATLNVGTWQLRVVKASGTVQEKVSNRIDVYVQPAVGVESATLSCVDGAESLALTGHGFGPQPPAEALMVGVFSGSEHCAVTSWTDTSIVASCTTADVDATVSVIGAFNIGSPVTATVGGAGCAVVVPEAPVAVVGATVKGVVYTTPGVTSVKVPFSRYGYNVTFDGAASTGAASYQWTLAGPKTGTFSTASFTTKLSGRGTYTATLVVTSADGQKSAPTSFSVTIQ
jgi:hypothetical protein